MVIIYFPCGIICQVTRFFFFRSEEDPPSSKPLSCLLIKMSKLQLWTESCSSLFSLFLPLLTLVSLKLPHCLSLFSHSHPLSFRKPTSLHRFQHTHNYLTVSLSHVCHWGHSLALLSCSNTAVHHHDCNSSSACNSRPSVTQVIQLPFHHDNGTMVHHQVTRSDMSHMQSCATGLVTAAITLSGLATHITDHWTGWDVVQRPGSGVTVRWIRQILI